MKNEFIGFYEPTEKEIDRAWKDGTFAFDANSILNLYRYTHTTRNDFISAIKKLKDRLFFPYQAALEFHTNRTIVIDEQEKSYQKLLNIIKSNYEKTVSNQINEFKRHPSISIDRLTNIFEGFLKDVETELEKQRKTHPNFIPDDEILKAITELFDNCVGEKFSKKDLNLIYEEGKERYSSLIPPGYKDADKRSGDQSVYGDLIIWKELIKHAKAKKRPVIFVTDDRKEDWWKIQSGKTIRPREELIKEFFDLTGIRILIYNAEKFLQYANEKKFVPALKKETIPEISDIRISDEKSNALQLYLSNLNDSWKQNVLFNMTPSLEKFSFAMAESNAGLSDYLKSSYDPTVTKLRQALAGSNSEFVFDPTVIRLSNETTPELLELMKSSTPQLPSFHSSTTLSKVTKDSKKMVEEEKKKD